MTLDQIQALARACRVTMRYACKHGIHDLRFKWMRPRRDYEAAGRDLGEVCRVAAEALRRNLGVPGA